MKKESTNPQSMARKINGLVHAALYIAAACLTSAAWIHRGVETQGIVEMVIIYGLFAFVLWLAIDSLFRGANA